MAKIWVHVEPGITADGAEAKTALTKTLKATIEKKLVELIAKALPADTYTLKDIDKPKPASSAFNAIKIAPGLKLKVESRGSLLKVGCDLKMTFEAIKTPNLKVGNLLSQGSKGAAVENRRSGEKAIAAFASDALDAIVGPLVKQVISHPRFSSYGRSMGLPL